ncbi:MAG TPA: phosphofructokinase [Chlorobaculum sp.]|uniref:Phosphofructokinase n=1 Tax=Chlorobaculum tepidum (strain ATCC 49652 / DSM 12025 / NBRC 103806 / TLS) TaxID=194439 RepID=Q8KFS2_CHLTE|nr:6-phosphofructokinase [Chlorobaculum tepidum]AAM71496.1 phosphofructokinase [Chlorobaculum tepidum TLS]HBU23724.1 phosphofructokinase [Chlorobaculum sp.]
MHIGVLTGGGDAPGINACIKTIVTISTEKGYRVTGIRRGWNGLLAFDPDDPASRTEHIVDLDSELVRRIDRTGGTLLHTSRINPGNLKKKEIPPFLRNSPHLLRTGLHHSGNFDLTDHVLRSIDALGLDVIIVIGGDDTIGYADHLAKAAVKVIGVPKTMDNDVYGSDYCIGFGTAVTRSVQYIHQLRTSSGSHERITIVELFGRSTGETCLVSAYLAGVDRALIPEVPFDPETLADYVIQDKAANPSQYAMIAISEGARMIGSKMIEYCGRRYDEDGHEPAGIGQLTRETISMLTGQDVICQQLGYLMRSGIPDALDLMVGFNFAQLAVELIAEGTFGVMVALQKGIYTCLPLAEVSSNTKQVDISELYDPRYYRPKMRSVMGKPMFLY